MLKLRTLIRSICFLSNVIHTWLFPLPISALNRPHTAINLIPSPSLKLSVTNTHLIKQRATQSNQYILCGSFSNQVPHSIFTTMRSASRCYQHPSKSPKVTKTTYDRHFYSIRSLKILSELKTSCNFAIFQLVGQGHTCTFVYVHFLGDMRIRIPSSRYLLPPVRSQLRLLQLDVDALVWAKAKVSGPDADSNMERPRRHSL